MADDKEEFKISINQDYAKRFEKNKQRAELDRLKAKYGDEAVAVKDDDSSSSETEDEDAKEVTAQKEKDFLKVLSLLKKKDPRIYDKEATFYQSDDSSENSSDEGNEGKRKKPKKPMFLKDYERERLLEKGSKAFVSDDESSDEETTTKHNSILTYNEEQIALKESFKMAAVENDEDVGFLSFRQKTKDEKQQEDQEYKNWLKGQKKIIDEKASKEMDTLQRYWTDPNLDKDEVFLRDYILDRKYVDKDDERIPTYEEIVNDEKEDEEEVEKQEAFERKFNFRFQEPDASFVKTYPRTISASVRQKDERRKEVRKQREERKNKEKEQKQEEIKRLKNLKRKEIQEKLDKLKEITGNPNVGFTDEDVEGDFDPAKYDEAMKNIFTDGYYEDVDEEKPQFDADMDDTYEENWDEWVGPSHYDNDADQYAETEYEPHYDDPGFIMDADYDPSAVPESATKKSKKKSKFSRALEKKKPLYDPNEKTFEEYFDEYYKLDYEDIIGDLPVRFKYRQVTPNDFGLSTEEVLEYPERELNEWVTVKKMTQYRTDEEERFDLKKYRKLSRDEKRRRRIFTSKGALTDTNETTSEENPRIDLAENAKNQPGTVSNNTETATNQAEEETPTTSEATTKKNNNELTKRTLQNDKRKNAFLRKQGWKRKLTAKEEMEMAKKKRLTRQFKGARKDKLAKLSTERLAAYGLNRKK